MKLTSGGFLTLIFFVVACKMAIAQTVLPKLNKAPVPNWVQEVPYGKEHPPEREVQEGYFISFYTYQVEVEKQQAYTKVVKEIVSESGIQNNGELYINFDPAYQKLILHEVSIRRGDQIINKLNLASFKVMADEQDLSRSIYNGSYAAYLILDDIRIGDRIEYAYTIDGRNPIFGQKYAEGYYLQSSAPVGQVQVRIVADRGRKLQFKCFNGVPQPQKKVFGDRLSYEWEDKLVPALEEEDYQPSWLNNYRYVQCSEWTSWEEVGNWAKEVNPVKDNLTGALRAKVVQIEEESKGNPYHFLTLATRFVQDDIRYMGVEVGEYSHRANAPEKVFGQRYGDCKDKSLLLASMLKQGGLKADLVLSSTTLGKALKDYLPSPVLFNHMIVQVNVKGRVQYLDPTLSEQGGDIKDLYVPDYGACLPLSGDKIRLAEIGPGIGGEMIIVEKYELQQGDSAAALLTVNTRYTGYQADINRSSLRNTGHAQLEKNYLDYYGKIYPVIRKEDSLMIRDDREKNELVVTEKYYIKEFLKLDEATKTNQAGFYANLVSAQLPALTGNRRMPVATTYPLDLSYTIKVVSSAGWNIETERVFLDRKDYLFGSTVSSDEDTLTLDYQFAYHSPVVGMKEMPQFVADLKVLNDKHLSYAFYVSPTDGSPKRSVLAMVYSILVAAITCYGCWKQYKNEGPKWLAEGFAYERIGGWLIVLALSVFANFVGYCFTLLTTGYFSVSKWTAFNMKGAETAILFKIFLAFELTMCVLIAVLAIFTFFLLLKRRDIFPQVAKFLYMLLVIFYLVEITCTFSFDFLATVDWKTRAGMIRNMLVAMIWLVYLYRSQRVRETFWVPCQQKTSAQADLSVEPEWEAGS